MPSLADQPIPRSAKRRQSAIAFAAWNRKAHYYLGLYFLFFLWLFSLTGLLLNHSSWKFAQFFPNRKISKFARPIQSLAVASDLEQARTVMGQLGIRGEIAWSAARSDPARLDFSVSRPGRIYQVQTDLKEGRAAVTLTEYNGWGVLRTLHTFVGVSPDDPRDRRDWMLTSIWAFSMDGVAAGLVIMVLTSFYMWWGFPEKRKAGFVALALGAAVGGLFVVGLRWLYG